MLYFQSKSKKKKWKKKKKDGRQQADETSGQNTTAAGADNFAVNVNDDRFAAIYTRPEFNIDPSEQNFKKTKGMESLIGEKQKRVGSHSAEKHAASATSSHNQRQASHPKAKKSKLDPEMTATLKSVKNKWEKNAKKNKKKKKSGV